MSDNDERRLKLDANLSIEENGYGARVSWCLLDDYNSEEDTNLTIEDCRKLRDWLNALPGI